MSLLDELSELLELPLSEPLRLLSLQLDALLLRLLSLQSRALCRCGSGSGAGLLGSGLGGGAAGGEVSA